MANQHIPLQHLQQFIPLMEKVVCHVQASPWTKSRIFLSERVSTLILFRIFICRQTISDRVVIMSLDHINGIGIPTSCGSKEFHKSSKMRIHFCFFVSSFVNLTALDRSSYLLERSKWRYLAIRSYNSSILKPWGIFTH
jgi:hypothetical protein